MSELFRDVLRWDKDDPLHREIMDANKEAWLARHAAEYQARLDEIKRALPWWARLYMKVGRWLRR